MAISFRFFIFSLLCMNQMLAISEGKPIESKESEISPLLINQEARRWFAMLRFAKEKCRMDICMKQFKSVRICNGSETFFLWAKVIAADMIRYC